MAKWYILENDQTSGPFTAGEMRSKVDSGELTASSMVRKDGNSKFLAAKSFKGLIKTEADNKLQQDPVPVADKPTQTLDTQHSTENLFPAGNTTAVTGEIENNTASELLDTKDTDRMPAIADHAETVRTARMVFGPVGVPEWLLSGTKAYLYLGCLVFIVCLVSALRS